MTEQESAPEEYGGIQSRFSGAEYVPYISEITIGTVGCGGIGSPFHLTISRMNPKQIINWEGDVVELHNLGGQLFSLEDLGELKATATRNRLNSYSEYDAFVNLGWFEEEEESRAVPVMFLCVDNNGTRANVAKAWKAIAEESNWEFEIEVDGETKTFPWVLFDGRLSFNSFDVFVVTQENIDYYLENDLPIRDTELLPPDCTTKSNPEVGYLVGNYMVTFYRNWVQNAINIMDEFPATKNVPYRYNMNLSTLKSKTYGFK